MQNISSTNTTTSSDSQVEVCRYCGRQLDFKVFRIGSVSHCVYVDCSCEQAVDHRCKQQEVETLERKAVERLRRVERFRVANVPVKFYDAPLRREDAFDIVRSGKGLYLQGDNGCGKTELAAAITCQMLDRGAKAYFTSAVELKSELFSTSSRTKTEEQLFSKLSQPWLLVVDDVGKECGSKPVVSMLYRIVDERDKSERPLIMTSNFSKRELTARLAECGDESLARAITSRLFGMTKKFELTGRDWRIPER